MRTSILYPEPKVTITKLEPIYRVTEKETVDGTDMTSELSDTWNVEYDYNGEKRDRVIESSFLILLRTHVTRFGKVLYSSTVWDKTLLLYEKEFRREQCKDYESMIWYQYEKERILENLKRDWYDSLEEIKNEENALKK